MAGSPSGSVIHWAAASSALPVPEPLAPIARATSRRAPGATPTGAPPALPATIVPAVWVPWPLSSTGVGLAPHEVAPAEHLPREVLRGGVHPRVDRPDHDALAAHPERLPGGGRADRVDAPVAAAGVREGDGRGVDGRVGDPHGDVEVDRRDGRVGGDRADLVRACR